MLDNQPRVLVFTWLHGTLLLKHGRSNTSPIRTMTNGSIMNHSMNMNRLYNSLPGHTTTNGTNGEVNGNNLTSEIPNGAPPFEVR